MTSNIKFQTNRHTYVCNFQVKMKLQNDLIMNLKLKQHFCSQLRYTRTNRRSDVHGINFFILTIEKQFFETASRNTIDTPIFYSFFRAELSTVRIVLATRLWKSSLNRRGTTETSAITIFRFLRSNLRPAIKYFHRHIYPRVIIYDYYNL